ncbi:hypothetical protein B0H14DRAFT_3501707 [Mycena olivaceomarginata]|nr:hypothetical protein B0H14DRAFT_3501707 [Mycena olivaceomarginata]
MRLRVPSASAVPDSSTSTVNSKPALANASAFVITIPQSFLTSLGKQSSYAPYGYTPQASPHAWRPIPQSSELTASGNDGTLGPRPFQRGFSLDERRGTKRRRETDAMISTFAASKNCEPQDDEQQKRRRIASCSICRTPGHYAKTCSNKREPGTPMGSMAPPNPATIVNSEIVISTSALDTVGVGPVQGLPQKNGEPQDDEQKRRRVPSCSICRKPGHYAKTCSVKVSY